MTRKNIPLLLDEHPVMVYPTLARLLGINEAIILQQLHYLLNIKKLSEKGDNHYSLVDGEWWVYNTYDEWQEDHFPWLSTRSIQRHMLELEKKGIVRSRQSVKHKSDRRKWYTIDYTVFQEYVIHDDNPALPTRHFGTINHDDKLARSNMPKLRDGYTETSTETPKIKDIASGDAAHDLDIPKAFADAIDELDMGDDNTPDDNTPSESEIVPDPVTPAPAGSVKPDVKATAKESDTENPHNPVFDAVAEYVYETDPALVKTDGGRIGAIAAWLQGKSDGARRGKSAKVVVGYISAPAQPEHVQKFMSWFKAKYPNITLRDFERFVEYWRQWATEMNASTRRQQSSAVAAEQRRRERAQRRALETGKVLS